MATAESTMIGRLKLLRQELGLTQREFASRAGLSYGKIRDIEQGIYGLTIETLEMICGAARKIRSGQSAERSERTVIDACKKLIGGIS